MTRHRRAVTALLLAAAQAGCAVAPPPADPADPAQPTQTADRAATAAAPAASAPVYGTHPSDPWEAFNRQVWAFNDALDEAIVKPVAIAYRDYVPRLVRTGIDNLLSNIDDVWSTANHLMQGKVQHGVEMGFRVMANTFFGLGGLLDPATEMRLVKRKEDFGQTLGRWGVGAGPYVVLPLFGPRTLRDSFTLLVDRQFDPDKWVQAGDGRWAVFGLEVVNIRSNLLDATGLIDKIALDRYTFVRDGYLARRRDAVHDGAPPPEPFDDEFKDEGDDPPPK